MKFKLTGDGAVQRIEYWPEEADWLELSIEKIQFIVECVEAGMEVYSCGNCTTCGLCHYCSKLELDGAKGCEPCPVMQRTGQRGCKGTPYSDWVDLYSKDKPMTLEVAHEWLKFLEDLRPAWAIQQAAREV